MIQRMIGKNLQQALQRAKRTMPAPEKLAELIELVNLLPVQSIGLREMSDNIQSRYPEANPNEIDELFLNEFETYVGTLPERIKQFIGAPRDPENPAFINQAAARRYNVLVESLDLLILIAAANRTAYEELRLYSKPINEENMEEIWASRNLLNLTFSTRFTPMELIRNERGELEWRPNILFKAMQKAKHLRIRHCLICGLFFWAGRIDQPACSKRCTQTLRVRRWRADYQGKYKQQRIHKAEEQEQQQKKSKRGMK